MANPYGGFVPRGKTLLGSGAALTDRPDAEGITATFDDVDYDNPPKMRSLNKNTCILVRNASGISLLPGRMVRWKAAQRGKQVDGYTAATAAEAAGIVDEWLPTAGAADKDIFWILTDGVSRVLSDLVGDTDTNFSENDLLVAITAATSQATSAGRMKQADFTGATSLLADQIINAIGRAMSANTTSQTNRQVLMKVKKLF